ncbi:MULTISPECIES: hypothetical protein [Serratia]|uniref:hypothetical protein n=1 Tax=Serratia TaxID=613 RepID=UPI0018D2E7D0|nr:hypothetical protein [Serratia marcescens]MBH1916876.1 hypothetical protein [Serratia marcescens]MBH2678219.1 hypothetical protein [Serratia marcescens]MDP8800898.1 hypothetical protein [Serratia marcescens]
MNYQHLCSIQPKAYGTGSLGRHMQRLERLSQAEVDVIPAVDSHSDAHKIAVSQEAKSNPVLALRLIQQGKPYQQVMQKLQSSTRHLSRFTQRIMAKSYPGWECLDTEDQNVAAFQYSMLHNDGNGYQAGLKAALVALDKFVEPLTLEDITRLAN